MLFSNGVVASLVIFVFAARSYRLKSKSYYGFSGYLLELIPLTLSLFKHQFLPTLLPNFDNVIKITREEKKSGNEYARISRVYYWPHSGSGNAKLLSRWFGKKQDKEFLIKSRKIKREGQVINKDGDPADIHYWDLIETVEPRHNMVMETLEKYEAKLLPQHEYFNDLEFFFFNYPNEHDDKILDDLSKNYRINNKRFDYAKPNERLIIIAWQIRDVIYYVVESLKDSKFQSLQSTLIPVVDFEAHSLIQNNLRKIPPGLMDIGKKSSFNDIFGSDRLLISIAALTHEEAELWYSLTMIMHSAKAKGTLASAISDYMKMNPDANPPAIKMIYNRAVNKLQKPLLKILGYKDPALAIWICQRVVEELLDRGFPWRKPYQSKTELLLPDLHQDNSDMPLSELSQPMEIAYIMVNCMEGAAYKIQKNLKEMNYVFDVLDTHGSYDIVVKIVSPTLEDLRDTVYGIRKMGDIRSTTTLVLGNKVENNQEKLIQMRRKNIV